MSNWPDTGSIPLPESEDEPPTNPATIRAINERLVKGSERMGRMEERMVSLEGAMQSNTEMTAAVYEIVLLGRRFFFYLGKIGGGIAVSVSWGRKAVLWVGPPVALIAGAWHAAGDAIKAWLHLGGTPP